MVQGSCAQQLDATPELSAKAGRKHGVNVCKSGDAFWHRKPGGTTESFCMAFVPV